MCSPMIPYDPKKLKSKWFRRILSTPRGNASVPDLTISRVFDALNPAGSGEGVSATERVGLGMATVMVRPHKSGEFVQKVKQHLGIELANAPVRCRSDQTSFIGTGTGKWLAVF